MREVVNNLNALLSGKQAKSDISKELQAAKETVEANFVSDYEIAAQDIVTYIEQSQSIDLDEKRRLLYLDLLISGECYFRMVPSPSGENIQLDILDPLNTFVDINLTDPIVNKCQRSVVRKWMNLPQVLERYGKYLKEEQIKDLQDNWERISVNRDGDFVVVKNGPASDGYPRFTGTFADLSVNNIPGYGNTGYYYSRFIPVYEVEWLQADRIGRTKDFKINRYKQVRICQEIYVLNQEPDETAIRSHEDPNSTTLSINGIFFANKRSTPYSLVLACSTLQDKYNIMWFYRDNIIATSGTTGERIDVSKLPEFLGENMPERLVKWQAYKKQGMALFDTSQEGMAAQNTIVGEYDDTLRVSALQAIDLAIQSIENTCSSITGVFRERLNGIQQYDAVSNVKIGARNSFVVTKQYFQQMDLVTREILLDGVNLAKIVFKKGLSGTIILGDDRQEVFTLDPVHYTITDHDIHISNAIDAKQEIEALSQLTISFVQSGQVSPDIIVETINCKSATEYKSRLKAALGTQQKVQQAMQELQEKLEQLTQQNKQYEKELQKAQQQLKHYSDQEIQLKAKQMQLDNELEWFKARTEKVYKDNTAEISKKKLDVEIKQLTDNNPYNNKLNLK